jgi:hypothetical protein
MEKGLGEGLEKSMVLALLLILVNPPFSLSGENCNRFFESRAVGPSNDAVGVLLVECACLQLALSVERMEGWDFAPWSLSQPTPHIWRQFVSHCWKTRSSFSLDCLSASVRFSSSKSLTEIGLILGLLGILSTLPKKLSNKFGSGSCSFSCSCSGLSESAVMQLT